MNVISLTIVGSEQLSVNVLVAVAIQAAIRVSLVPSAHSKVRSSAGQENTGASQSSTTTLNEHVTSLPMVSVSVYVTVEVPS